MSKSKAALNGHTQPAAPASSRMADLAKELAKWNKQFKVEHNQQNDSVVLSATRVDITIPELRQLCDIIGDDDYTLNIARSADKFRIVIW